MEKNNTAFDEIEPRSQIDVMMRTTVQKNTALSGMADQKANILTASSFILLTVLVSRYNELQFYSFSSVFRLPSLLFHYFQ